MGKENYQTRIGKDKILVYNPDSSAEPDEEFLRQFNEAGASNPATIQDFFIRLAEIQKQPINPKERSMQIELKNIKVLASMTEETIAFTANLYVDTKKIAFVKNAGAGGSTHYQLYKKEDEHLLKATEEYCKRLPSQIYTDTKIKGKSLSVPMNLENYISDLLNAYMLNREQKSFQAKVVKHQEDSILYGTAGMEYTRLKFNKSIAEILKQENGIEVLRKTIQEKVLPKLKEGESILNANLPSELITSERKRISKINAFPEDTERNKQRRI